MNDSTYTEKDIHFKDMLYWALKRWRKILVGALIIALLAGLFQVLKGLLVMIDDEKLAEVREKYEITYEDYQATGERLKTYIKNLREQSANQQEYNEQSILMKIDPMEKWEGSFQLYIDSKYQIDPTLSYQNVDMTNRLISAYDSYLRSGEFYQELLAQIEGVDEIRYLTEIYGVTADPSIATITVGCMAVTEADVRQILDFVKTRVAAQYEAVRSAIGDHDYQILTESVYSTIDLNLDSTQKANLLAITDYANKIGETKQALTTWEKVQEPEPEFGIRYTVKQAIIFLVVGGIVGAIVVFLCFAAKYVLSDTMKTDDDWRAYELPVLGHISVDEDRKKFLPIVDTLIDRTFGCRFTTDMEQACVLTAQNLSAVLKKQGLTTGTLTGRLPEGLAEKITQKMNAAGINVRFRYAGNALTDAATAGNLGDDREVLVYADRYGTSCAEIKQLMTLMNAWGKTVLGVVVVG